MTKMIIFGSRTLKDKRIKEILEKEIDGCQDLEEIITGGETAGVSQIGRELARKKAIPLKLFFLNQDRYGRAKYDHRSKEILAEGNYAVVIWNGKSKGTFNELELIKKMKIRYKLYLVEDIELEFIYDNFDLDAFDFTEEI
ncbi:MAG: hypothetical protein AB1567_06975 [bacterium]